MSCQLTITEKPGYLHCIVTGRNTVENVASYLQELARATSPGSRPWPTWT